MFTYDNVFSMLLFLSTVTCLEKYVVIFLLDNTLYEKDIEVVDMLTEAYEKYAI